MFDWETPEDLKRNKLAYEALQASHDSDNIEEE